MTNASGVWITYTIDSGDGYFGDDNSIAVDSNNKVHISYRRSDGFKYFLKYATNLSDSWANYTVTTDSTISVQDTASIAMDV
ncbi:MAG: carboxypeptidase regulatory-like domain-containing protein, partial [Nitrospirae bacterium]|nr:carboxypeptidase regulatory-like domain-containing protein [Nitrospirota bacterium]